MNFSLNLSLALLAAASVESLTPDGVSFTRGHSFAQQPGMQYGYRGSDMSLQNDFYGVPSFAQQGGFGGGGGGGGYGREEFGMPSFQQQGMMGGGMRGGGGMGGGMGDFPPRGDFGRGSMAMGARRGILPDEDFGLNAEMGSMNRRSISGGNGGRSMTSNYFGGGGRPSYHHAMSPGGGFQADMGFDMSMDERMGGGGQGPMGGMGRDFRREEFRQMGRDGGMGGRERMGGQRMGGGGQGMGSFRGGGGMGNGQMNGQGMGSDFGRDEFRQSGSSAQRSMRPNNWN